MTKEITNPPAWEPFFKALYDGTEHETELRALPSCKQLFAKRDNTAQIEGFIKNNINQNLYFGVCTRQGQKGDKAATREVTSLWTDIDFKDFAGGEEEAKEFLGKTLHIPTSAVVHTGNGLHLYWLLKEPEDSRPEIEAILKGLTRRLRGDMQAAELARILRIPGTFNYKDGGKKPVKLIKLDSNLRYNLSDFEDFKDDTPVSDAVAHTANVQEITDRCAFLKYCHENRATLPEPLWYAMVSNVSRISPGGPDLVHAMSQGHPGYSRSETDQKILHSLNGAGPHTCQNIKDTMKGCIGEDCGKDCHVKAPIALLNGLVKVEVKKTDVEKEWFEPLPLPEGLPPVKALDSDMIPEPLRKWLMDISDRMQIPPDFSTAAAVVAAGSIIGRGCGIYPKRHDDWLVIANLWGAVIGRPSLMKTPAITEAQRHLVRLETEAKDKYTEEAHSSEIDKEIQKITRAAIAEDIKKAVKAENSDAVDSLRTRLAGLNAEEPTRRRFQTQDGTTEKIGELLNQNPRGLLVNRDELIGWFHALDKPGREGDRAFNLEAWNGARGYTYDRIGRGTLDIDALCLSVFGAITPGPLSDYVYQASRGGDGDDGLLQRFQVMVWPDTPSEWKNIDRFPDSKEKERAWGIFSKLALDSLGSSVVGQYTGEIPALRFTPSGQEIFDAWRHNLEIRLRSDHGLPPSLESHLAKYRSLMPSLSLIFHLVEVVDGKATGAVSETAALMAAAWCDYLESHAMRVYGGATMPGMESAREIVKHIRRGAIQDGCKPKDIYRNQWSRLATPEEVKVGLDVLSEYDWLIIEKINTGGRPSEIVRLNPGIKV